MGAPAGRWGPLEGARGLAAAAQLGDGSERRWGGIKRHRQRRAQGGRGRPLRCSRFKIQKGAGRGRDPASNLRSGGKGSSKPPAEARLPALRGNPELAATASGRRESRVAGRGFAAAVPALPAAASSGWNEGNPRAEGSSPPPPNPEPRCRIPGMPAGSPAANARQRKEGAYPSPGGPEGRPSLGHSPRPPPSARPTSLDGNAGSGGRVGRR